ncbi:Citrate synthase [Talaromyces pinophilus]|nr:Citrate synthase [Talaromyces pinophilus]
MSPAAIISSDDTAKSVDAKASTKTTVAPISRNFLHVIDERTGQYYQIPIHHNAISANEFKKIKAPDTEYYADQNENGIRVFDPGFTNTAVVDSKVTYVDGKRGKIQYRGYDLADVVANGKKFIDTAHLMVFGFWPSADEGANFQRKLFDAMHIDQCVFDTIRAFPPTASTTLMLTAGLAAVQATQMDKVPAHMAKNLYLGNPTLVDEQIIRLMGVLPIVSAVAYCHHTGRAFKSPRSDLTYIENFLYMCGHVLEKTGLPNPRYVENFERLWSLVADHEMTCSTAAFLLTASSLPDPFSCIISGIGASYGPLHGGAIEFAYKDMADIGSVANCQTKIDRVKSGKERLFGYGHRVYKVTDPRSEHIQAVLETLKEEIDNDPLLKVAFELNRIAQEDEYFVSRGLKPNADLFAAFTYGAMGFPPDFILTISTISRTQGLMAHWKEAMSGKPLIWRPTQIYTGKLDHKMDSN